MPISYKYKIVFIHIPKCAGTSIEKMFDMSSEDQLFSTYRIKDTDIVVPKGKFKPQEYDCCVSKPPQHMTYSELSRVIDIDDTFTKFSIVRNPYSRFVSEFEYRRKFDKEIATLSDLADCLDLPLLRRTDRFHGHLETQVSYLRDGKKMFDGMVMKFEELSSYTDYFNKISPINTFPHSLKNSYSKPYQEYYTTEIADKVLNFYKEDFDMFKYSTDL